MSRRAPKALEAVSQPITFKVTKPVDKTAPPPKIAAPPTAISTVFSQSQLALALVIQKSRPEGVSTLEYCQQLRKYIKNGHPIPGEERRHIDGVGFWKDQYCKVHQEKKRLENKIIVLEEERRVMRERLEQNNDLANEERPSNIRQMLSKEYEALNSNARKRPAPHEEDVLFEARNSIGDTFPSPSEDTILKMSSYILRVSRQRIALEKATKTLDLTQLDSVTSSTIQILQILETAVFDCCLPLLLLKTGQGNTQGHTVLQQLLRQVSLTYCSCFNVFDEICRTIPGRKKLDELVYYMVMFFNKMMDLLQTISTQQAEHEAEQVSHRLRIPAKRAKPSENKDEYAINKYITSALSSIASSLNWKVAKPGHRDLLEGILFSILEHTGRLLSCAIFKEHVALSKSPANITKGKKINAPDTIKFESHHVVQILYAALGGSQRRDLVSRILASEREDSGAPNVLRDRSANPLKDLVDKARKLVQSTLVKSAVGGEEFESLKWPAAPAMDDVAIVESGIRMGDVNKYGSEWLIDMVWALIGWDMLG